MRRLMLLFTALGGLTALMLALAAILVMRGQLATRFDSPTLAQSGDSAEVEGDGIDGTKLTRALEFKPSVMMRSIDAADGKLGMTVDGSAMALAEGRQLVEGPGIVISSLVEDSPADRAGLRRGDILISVNGESVDGMAELHGALDAQDESATLGLEVQRGDDRLTLDAQLDGEAIFMGIMTCGGSMLPSISMLEGLPALSAAGHVSEVFEDSAAADAGILAGDRIVAVDGQALDEGVDLAELIVGHSPGDAVQIEIERGLAEDSPESLALEVVLGEHPDDADKAFLGIGYALHATGAWHEEKGMHGFLGFLPEMLHEAFSFDGMHERHHEGAHVVEVVDDSPAAIAGLLQGDTITAVDGQEIGSTGELIERIDAAQPGDVLALSVQDKDGEARQLELTLGQSPDGDGDGAWMGVMMGDTITIIRSTDSIDDLDVERLDEDGNRVLKFRFDSTPSEDIDAALDFASEGDSL